MLLIEKTMGRCMMVSDNCIRKIAIALKSDHMTDTCRNQKAALILDDLYTVDELAAMSLSGRKCPGQDRAAKPKLPPDIVTAIHSRPKEETGNLNSIFNLIFFSDYLQQVWDEAFTTRDKKTT